MYTSCFSFGSHLYVSVRSFQYNSLLFKINTFISALHLLLYQILPNFSTTLVLLYRLWKIICPLQNDFLHFDLSSVLCVAILQLCFSSCTGSFSSIKLKIITFFSLFHPSGSLIFPFVFPQFFIPFCMSFFSSFSIFPCVSDLDVILVLCFCGFWE